MINKTIKSLSLLCLIFILIGCDGLGSIPKDKQNYVGSWYGKNMRLVITEDAHVDYQYEKGNSSKSISAPIIAFIGDDFKVGALGIETLFVVSKAPYFEDNVWKMIVDDQLVVRKKTENDTSSL